MRSAKAVLETSKAHRDDLLDARREAGHEAVGEAALRLGVEEEAANLPEGLLQGADVREGLVVEARHEQHPVRHGEARLADQREEVRPGQHAVVVGRMGAEVFDEGGGVDARMQPLELLLAGQAAAARKVDLQPREAVDLERVGREAAHRHPVPLEGARRKLVLPRRVVLRARAEHLDAVAEADRVQRQRVQERLGAADGAGLVQARGNEGEGHRASSASMRAVRASISFLWRRFMISTAASSTPLVWFCCDQSRKV